jgi:hypothetical protein
MIISNEHRDVVVKPAKLTAPEEALVTTLHAQVEAEQLPIGTLTLRYSILSLCIF